MARATGVASRLFRNSRRMASAAQVAGAADMDTTTTRVLRYSSACSVGSASSGRSMRSAGCNRACGITSDGCVFCHSSTCGMWYASSMTSTGNL